MSDERSFLETWSDVIKKTGQTHTFGQPSELERQLAQAQADLAAHKAVLVDVVERAVALCNAAEEAGHGHWCGVLAEQIASLAPPDAAPYAKVLEAARRIDASDSKSIADAVAQLREALKSIGRG